MTSNVEISKDGVTPAQQSNSPRVTLGIAAGMMIIGSLLDWVNLKPLAFYSLTNSVSGIERGSGILTLILGMIFLIAALVKKGKPGVVFSVWVGVFAILLSIFMIYEWSAITAIIHTYDNGIQMTFGIGFYLTLIGSFISVIGGFLKS